MSLHLDTMTADDLRSATLADIADAVRARDSAAFRQSWSTVDRAGVLDATRTFSSLLGWAPRGLVAEWLAIEAALPTHDSSACWTAEDRSLSMDLPPRLPDEAE